MPCPNTHWNSVKNEFWHFFMINLLKFYFNRILMSIRTPKDNKGINKVSFNGNKSPWMLSLMRYIPIRSQYTVVWFFGYPTVWTRGGQPKLVAGPQYENFASNLDLLGRMITKTWRNSPKISKNCWFSIRVWAAKICFWAAGHPWFGLLTRSESNQRQNLCKYRYFW
jgi:hypothetical protein